MTDDDIDDTRAFITRLFRTDEEPDESTTPTTTGNVVPKEGRHIAPPVDPDAEMRRYTRVLFGYNADD